ncbi:MAG: hypothetical protein GY874_05180 [Desulfobacteraceae bacterium]|nr:hypothetical protein [Desulfobacteraceae bacterium]
MKKNLLKRIAYKAGALYSISPKDLLEAVKVCHVLGHHGTASTLGNFSKAGDDPIQIIDEHRLASDFMACHFPSDIFYLSIKPPALGFNADHVKTVAVTALKNGQGVHFDSHDHIDAEPTLQLLKEMINKTGLPNETNGRWRYGLSIPSRWRRSLSDAQWAAKNGVRIRLIKGEFKASNPSEEMDPGKGFMQLAQQLAGQVPEVAIATHDHKLAKAATTLFKKTDTAIQLELLFGMPTSKMIALSKDMMVSTRIYVPYSDILLLYGAQQLLTNIHKIFRPGFVELFLNYKSKISRIVSAM